MKKHPLADLEADIRHHIERETEDNIERGMSPEDARDAALRKFGNITLALGIGATTAIYGVVDAILLQPLPFSNSDRLVRVVENYTSGTTGRVFQRGLRREEFLDWHEAGAAHVARGCCCCAHDRFALVATLASCVPARRATKINPIVALRND